jgi:ABC-2 type transport system permease protein
MKSITRSLRLVWAAFSEQLAAERAYLGNFWFGLLSKLIYNFMFLFFIDQLYARVGHFAGFSKNDFLFLYFVSQTGFYICYHGIFASMIKLVQTVRTGNFDLFLLKPVPHRSFLYIQGTSFYEVLTTAIPCLFLIAFNINWPQLNLSAVSLALGLIAWLSGIIICNTLVFILTLPVFIHGEATETVNAFYSFTTSSQIPYSKLPTFMKYAALVAFPQIIVAGATAEIFLHKVDPFAILAIIVPAAVGSLVLVNILWKFALRNYTSASS